MSFLQVNGCACIRGRITLPLTGAWVADVVSNTESSVGAFPPPGSSATVQFGQQSFQGVVRRSSNPFGTIFARLIGGAGGLPGMLPPLSYQNTTVNQVLSDLLQAAGERLSPMSDENLLSQELAFWVRPQAPAWQSLAVLVDCLDSDGTWRVLPDGTIWVGVNSWPQTNLESFELLSFLPHELRAEIYTDNPTLMPGQSFLGGDVSSIEHIVEPTKIHSNVLFVDLQLATVSDA
jgi:hypothetical protein